jgi:hypothetical protein
MLFAIIAALLTSNILLVSTLIGTFASRDDEISAMKKLSTANDNLLAANNRLMQASDDLEHNCQRVAKLAGIKWEAQ